MIHTEAIPLAGQAAAVALAQRLVETGVQFAAAPWVEYPSRAVAGWTFSWHEAPEVETQPKAVA